MSGSPTTGPAPMVVPRRRRPLVTVKDFAWLLYVYPGRWIASILPAGAVRLAGRITELLCQFLMRQDKKKTVARLARALGPEVSERELRRIARTWAANGVRYAFHRLARKRSESSARHRRVEVRGLEHLQEAVAAGHGAILVSGHFFAGRLIRPALAELGYPAMGVRGGRLREWGLGQLGKKLVQPELRRVWGDGNRDHVLVDDPDCVLKIVKRLRSGGLVSLRLDVPFSRNVVERPFLGARFRFSTGFLEIARQTGCAVVPVLAVSAGSTFAVSLDPPLRLRPAATREDFISESLPLLVSRLEFWIRQYPDQWEPWLSLEP